MPFITSFCTISDKHRRVDESQWYGIRRGQMSGVNDVPLLPQGNNEIVKPRFSGSPGSTFFQIWANTPSCWTSHIRTSEQTSVPQGCTKLPLIFCLSLLSAPCITSSIFHPLHFVRVWGFGFQPWDGKSPNNHQSALRSAAFTDLFSECFFTRTSIYWQHHISTEVMSQEKR